MLRRLDRSIRAGAPGVEFGPDGKTPIAFRIWRDGRNDSDKGPVFFTDESRAEVLRRYAARGLKLMIDFDHESTVPPEMRRAGAAEGFGVAAGKCTPALRGKDLWAESVQWTARALAQIHARERDQVSPAFYTDDNGVILELVNVALCFEGATHHGVSLAAWRRNHGRTGMKEKIAALRAMLEAMAAGGSGTVEEVLTKLAELESMADAVDGAGAEGGDAMGEEMRRMADDQAGMKKEMGEMYAYLRTAMPKPGAAPQRHDRAPSPDAIEARRAHVGVIIERAGDIVSADDARWLTEQASPDLAKRYVGGLQRLSRDPRGAASGVKPPADSGSDREPELTAADIKAIARTGVDAKKYLAQKHARLGARHNGRA